MKVKHNMCKAEIKDVVLYRIPNKLLLKLFNDKNGVYKTYEAIKYRNGQLEREYILGLLKLSVVLCVSLILSPFVATITAYNVYICNRIFIPRLEIVLTTYCTLKCKDCSNLMQYYDKPYNIEYHKIIDVLDKITDSIDYLSQLVLLGGEPFIYPNLAKVLHYANNNSKIKRICIKSNGIFKLNNEVIEELKNNKVHLDISDYGVNSKLVRDNCKLLDKENVVYFCQDRKPWYNMGDMNRKNRTKKELIEQYRNCGYKCRCVLNGKMYICPRSSHGTDLGFFDEKAFLDLMDDNMTNKELGKKILKFYYYENPILACDWCDAGTVKCTKIPCGRQAVKND